MPMNGSPMRLPECFATSATDALPLYCVERTGFDDWRALQLPELGSWIDAHTFTATSGSVRPSASDMPVSNETSPSLPKLAQRRPVAASSAIRRASIVFVTMRVEHAPVASGTR